MLRPFRSVTPAKLRRGQIQRQLLRNGGQSGRALEVVRAVFPGAEHGSIALMVLAAGGGLLMSPVPQQVAPPVSDPARPAPARSSSHGLMTDPASRLRQPTRDGADFYMDPQLEYDSRPVAVPQRPGLTGF